jgi:histidyl-tRNA synthetase
VTEFRAPKGTHDVLPPISARWQRVIDTFADHAGLAGFGLLIQPMFEDIGVFQRVGASTDLVRKEMYDFRDKGDRHLVLRPEGTAAVARAFLEHRPPTPWKVWYTTPKFRYERPQAGRYRQHHEVGVEVLGSDDPDLDVEVIALAWSFYGTIGITDKTLLLNSLGDAACRPAYRDVLERFLTDRRDQLCAEHRDRIADNPLRVLDCKRAECVGATDDAPHQIDHLCDECAAHFDRVKAGLDAAGVPYRVHTRLVRGLDYYTRTTFEFAGEALDSAQNAIGGGGRYDGLVEQLGGPPTPGIGFGLGIERILLACDAEGVLPAPVGLVDVFVIDLTGGERARDVARTLRASGLRTDRGFDNRSLKSQLKAADRSGAQVAVIIGAEEAEAGEATVRNLRGDDPQQRVTLDQLADHIRKRIHP